MELAEVHKTFRELIQLLSDGRFPDIQRQSYQRNLTSEEMKLAISEYSGSVTIPPDDGLKKIDICQISADEIAFDFDLWIDGSPGDVVMHEPHRLLD